MYGSFLEQNRFSYLKSDLIMHSMGTSTVHYENFNCIRLAVEPAGCADPEGLLCKFPHPARLVRTSIGKYSARLIWDKLFVPD